jgi:hypothetical protein
MAERKRETDRQVDEHSREEEKNGQNAVREVERMGVWRGQQRGRREKDYGILDRRAGKGDRN